MEVSDENPFLGGIAANQWWILMVRMSPHGPWRRITFDG
jgi:hypothetical protein